MDQQIYDVLSSIDATLTGLAAIVQQFSDHWLPVLIGGIALIVISILVSWLVKI